MHCGLTDYDCGFYFTKKNFKHLPTAPEPIQSFAATLESTESMLKLLITMYNAYNIGSLIFV